MKYKIGDIIIFKNNHSNAYSIGTIIDLDYITRVELIKSGGNFLSARADEQDYISGWDSEEKGLISETLYNSYNLKYSTKLWNVGRSYTILTKVDPLKHDIYKLADIMNSRDIDLINLTLDMLFPNKIKIDNG